MKTMLVASILVALVLPGVGLAAPPVSNISVTPSPVYEDLGSVSLRFVTTAAAPVGRLYFALLQSDGTGDSSSGCSPSSRFNVKGVRGGAMKTVAIALRPEALFGDAFCPGPAHIDIYTQIAGSDGRVRESATKGTYQRLATYRLRIYHTP